jgi:hypothetical protein
MFLPRIVDMKVGFWELLCKPFFVIFKHMRLIKEWSHCWSGPGDIARKYGELRYQLLFIDGFLTCLCAHVLDGCSLILHYKGG